MLTLNPVTDIRTLGSENCTGPASTSQEENTEWPGTMSKEGFVSLFASFNHRMNSFGIHSSADFSEHHQKDDTFYELSVFYVHDSHH